MGVAYIAENNNKPVSEGVKGIIIIISYFQKWDGVSLIQTYKEFGIASNSFLINSIMLLVYKSFALVRCSMGSVADSVCVKTVLLIQILQFPFERIAETGKRII